MEHVRIPIARLKEARNRIEDDQLPVTLSRLSQKTRIRLSTLWYMVTYSAPWLRKELKIVRGLRDDDRYTEMAYRAAGQRVRRKHGFVAYFMLAEELGTSTCAVKDYVNAHPTLKKSLRCIGCWEAKYRLAAASVPEEVRTIERVSLSLREMFHIGSLSRTRAYLRRNPRMIQILKLKSM